MKDAVDETSRVLLIAEAAGLHKAIAQFRNEVLAAAKSAASARDAFTASDDATVEPWPPMRTRGGA
jgi:hypothetical protein